MFFYSVIHGWAKHFGGRTMADIIKSPRIRIKEVMQILGCSKTHVYDLHNRRLLLRRTEGTRFTYWLRAEVEAFARGLNPYDDTPVAI